ncbi:MAG: hypothetical protein HYZ63_01605 [Candidatus Andersenbacteria bacterium]|nr:hypothetical protein [Candidatus Andersenbacteria bacterium]
MSTTHTATKKEQILELFQAGASSIGELAALTNSQPSYVASVLRDGFVAQLP